jgi:hypothetical protein
MWKLVVLSVAILTVSGCQPVAVAKRIPEKKLERDMQDFINRYQAAWASTTPNAMKVMWHPQGMLYHPILSEPITGEWVPANNNRTKAVVPGFRWSLLRWASQGEIVFIEWQTEAIVNGEPYTWTGVDRMRVVNGKVMEEYVYFDTFPLRAMQSADIPYTPMVDVKELEKFKVD